MSDLIRRFRETILSPRRFDDERGFVYEVLRFSETTGQDRGQVFVTAAYPGQSKGHHYHTRKTEWFCVVSGEGEMVVEDVASGARDAVAVTAATPQVLRILPGLAHALRNSGSTTLLSLVYVDEAYDPSAPDTHPHRLF
jgi:dTDP-4-dehydrorhamnose 3,5-epimerase-like enzyme